MVKKSAALNILSEFIMKCRHDIVDYIQQKRIFTPV